MSKPQMSKSLHKLSVHSRNTKTNSKTQKTDQKRKKKNDSKPDETSMDFEDDTKEDESSTLLSTSKEKSRGIYYHPFLYDIGSTDKTYYFMYFKSYLYDHRMLLNDQKGEPIKCHCHKGKMHHRKCPWYDPDIIYIVDFQEDLSPSELAAQQKIYNIYQNTIHNPPEHCGCRTATEIAYMGHSTECVEFQYIHERESYGVLFAILKKRKKVTFSGSSNNQHKRPRLHSPMRNEEAKEDAEEVSEMQKVPKAKEAQPNLSQKPTESLSVLADVALATSDATQSNTQP